MSYLNIDQLIIPGLLQTGSKAARKMALTIARRYTVGAMFSCPDGAEVCNMFEKVHFDGLIKPVFKYWNCDICILSFRSIYIIYTI